MATSDFTTQDIQRFWSKVNKDGSIPAHCPELGACWEWKTGKTKAGYGQFHFGSGHGQNLHAHRVSWELTNGEIPDGLWVLHKCDNPSCLNPQHLFLGTQIDNMRDMKNKGREASGEVKARRGEKHGCHKLTADQVKSIRERYAAGGITQYQLADEMGINQAQIWRIIHGKSWKVSGEQS